ncbi:MAG: tetratricopeptide repeat protein [Planctomycetes bacterium]|nr:tetratricopeptide repeat protein [Planctomycetota bacterium]
MAERSHPNPLLVALALFGVALALYFCTAGFPFVEYDDPGYVLRNTHIESGLTGASVRWAFTSTDYQYNWHPLTWLSHALDVELFAFDAGKHHLVNALLHALNAALLFLALRALTGRAWPSAFVAALFALHPLRVESVAWIAERKDVLAGTFFALTLLAYARYARAPSRRNYSWVALALGAGLMAKPTLVTVPCLLLVLDVWPLERRWGWRALVLEKVPLAALAAASIALTLEAQRAGGALDAPIALGARLANALAAYATYLGQYLWPVGLAVYYPHPALVAPEESRLVPALLALALLAGLTWGALRLRRRMPWLLVGWCWFLGLLVPMIGLVQAGTLAHADRYAYLAALGLELALVWSAAELVHARPAWRGALLGLGMLALAALTLQSVRQVAVWQSSEALFQNALAHTERNFVAHNNLGLALAQERRFEEAEEHFEAAAAISPRFFEAQLNLGKALYLRDDWAAARTALERAVALRPASADAHLSLAWALFRSDEHAAADAQLTRALECDPRLVNDESARRLGQELAKGLGGG